MILTCPPSKRRERDVRGGPRGRGSRRRPSTPRAGTRRSRRGAAPSKRWSSAPGTRSAIRCAFTIGANWWSVPFSSRVGAEIFGSSSYASSRALARRCRRAPNAEMPGSRGSRTVRDGRPAIPACTWGRPLPRTPPRGRRRARRRRTTSMLRSTAWGPPGVVQPRTRRRTRSGWSTASHCATRQPSTCHSRPRSVGRGVEDVDDVGGQAPRGEVGRPVRTEAGPSPVDAHGPVCGEVRPHDVPPVVVVGLPGQHQQRMPVALDLVGHAGAVGRPDGAAGPHTRQH